MNTPVIHAPTLQACIEAGRHCAAVCAEHAVLARDAQHRGMLQRCTDVCQATADQLEAGITDFAMACEQCADVCSSCAAHCEQTPGFERCADACRNCAQICLTMGKAGTPHL